MDFPGRPRPLVFADPVDVIVAERVEEVRAALRGVQRAANSGLWAVGWVTYDAAPAFDPALTLRAGARMPLLRFAIHEEPASPVDGANHAAPGGGSYRTSEWTPDGSRVEFDAAIARIHDAIGRGDTYQVNHTLRLRAAFDGDPLAFHSALCAAQGRGYFAFIDSGAHIVLSASPELFFRRRGSEIVTRPMKGTSRRGRWLEEDENAADLLAASEKQRAENVMITDLLRNDLGRVAEFGSVRVASLFDVERYPTVLQMTSTITARLRPEIDLDDLFAALFPSGSVTGAPKVAAMKLIASLERSPRELYCGAIGMVMPGGESVFSVAIRTVWIDCATGVGEYGVGGGIVWDSTSGAEYDELRAKAALLTAESPRFELLETMRLEDGVFARRERHMSRLAASARYFDFEFVADRVRDALDSLAREAGRGTWRVRLLVSRDGAARAEHRLLEPSREMPGTMPSGSPPDAALTSIGPAHVVLASEPVSREDVFLFHKTTHRTVYEHHRALNAEAFDVLLWNEEGEITEFTIGNVVAELDGDLATPVRESGLLAGTFRAELLESGTIRERVIRKEDLERAGRVWLINSVREWVLVRVIQSGVREPSGTRSESLSRVRAVDGGSES